MSTPPPPVPPPSSAPAPQPIAGYPEQPYPGQPYPGQPYPGQPYPGQQYPGQPYPGQQYPGQQYPGQPYPGQLYAAQPQLNVLALVAFIASFVVSIVGIVCGHIALAQIKRTGERGRGLALAGVIIGYVGTAFAVICFALIAVGVIASSLDAARQSVPDSSGDGVSVSAADQSIVAGSSKDLASAIDAISVTMVDAPAPAREQLDTAAEAFKERVSGLQDVTLRTDAHYLNEALDSLTSDLAEYQSSHADDLDASQIKADVVGIKDELVTFRRDAG